MAYIPPHKRHSDDPGRPAPTPELLAHSFKRNLNLKASRSSPDKSGKIIYADHAKSNWFPVGLNDDNQIPSSVQLEPVSVEFIERRIGGKPLALVNDNIDESNEVGVDTSRRPWELITENVLGDLLSSFELLKAKIDGQNLEKVKPSLVARFGKILFHGSPSLNVSNLQKSQVSETTLKKLKRLFYSNVPMPYMDNVVSGVSPNIGDSCEKDIYHLKLSDKTRPEATISCKCGIKEDNKLTLYKVELNHVRYFVADISCLGKNLDMRLMLCSKNILIALTDDELHSIKELIDSAVIDPNVKGGLRWPLGKASSGDRFSVCGVWHTIATSYGSQTLRLKIRHADRFDFRTGTGECTREIILKLRGLLSKLQEENVEESTISDMLKSTLKLIWDKYSCCQPLFAAGFSDLPNSA